MNRRDFMQTSLIAGTSLALSPGLFAAEPKIPKLKKAVKFGMIAPGKTVQEKLELVKKLGFLGVEIDSPSGLNLEEVKTAAEATGIKVHGVIDSVHWNQPLSSPDEKVRATGLKALEGALNAAAIVGADTVLLVPGVVNKDATYEQCFERSQAEVKKAIPLAEKLGVKIAIEVVWNNFITKPEQFIEYIDAFKTPAVGGYMDCSNMLKYGVGSEVWIRKLGKRMLKFDFKGFNNDLFTEKKNPWVGIGEGSENWPEILKACAEVGYSTWATAEYGSSDEKALAEISKRMDKILQLEG